MNISDKAANGKSARRRHTRPEQVALNIEWVDRLVIQVKGAAAVTQLLDGIERRLAIVEDGMPAVGGLQAQSKRLGRLEEVVCSNSAARRGIEDIEFGNGAPRAG